jgi:hypothetical protein
MRGAASNPADFFVDCGFQLAEERRNVVVRCVGNLSTEVPNYIVEAALGHRTALEQDCKTARLTINKARRVALRLLCPIGEIHFDTLHTVDGAEPGRWKRIIPLTEDPFNRSNLEQIESGTIKSGTDQIGV